MLLELQAYRKPVIIPGMVKARHKQKIHLLLLK